VNPFIDLLCDKCNRYLLSPQGSPKCQFKYDGDWLCAECDPNGCAECGIYGCDCKNDLETKELFSWKLKNSNCDCWTDSGTPPIEWVCVECQGGEEE